MFTDLKRAQARERMHKQVFTHVHTHSYARTPARAVDYSVPFYDSPQIEGTN